MKNLMNKLQEATDCNLEDIGRAKQAGSTAIGFYCLYSPTEIAVAAGSISLPLCGTRNEPVSAAEEVLPRNLCPLIKSSYGFGISKTCPFFESADFIVGDTTCDGKKKMFELLSRTKPTIVLQLPQNQSDESSLTTWKQELFRFRHLVEERTGKKITDENLHDAIRLMNRERQARKRIMDLNKAIPAPLPGSVLLEIMFKVGFLADKEKGISLMNEVADLLGGQPQEPEKKRVRPAKRILLTGVPVGVGSDKVVKIVEQSGADVVAFENCSGYKQAFTVDEEQEPMEALAKQYLATPCSVMSPNAGRFTLLREMMREFSVDGVIDLTWQACHTYNIESYQVSEVVQAQLGVPLLQLETDYAESDTEQLRVRVEAYLEMI
ncbi:MAG: double-cubane-cluster-containing anaerobic reductase [Desulfopila sp.]